MRYEIRELNIGEILDLAFKLFKDHFRLLFLISTILLLPAMLLTGYLANEFQSEVVAAAANPNRFSGAAISFPVGYIVAYLVTIFLLAPVTDAAITFAVAKCYLDKPVGVMESFRRALAIFIPLMFTEFLALIAIIFGLVLILVPGIIFFFSYWLIGRVVVIEGLSGWEAMKRSKFLMKGNFGKAFVLELAMVIIAFVVGAGANFLPLPALRIVAQAILQVGTSSFVAGVWAVFYFSCRCKAENFDLTVLAESVTAKDDAPPEVGFQGNV